MFVASGHGLTDVINPSQAAASTAARLKKRCPGGGERRRPRTPRTPAHPFVSTRPPADSPTALPGPSPVRDNDRLADELVVLHKVLVAWAVEVDRVQHDASAGDLGREVLLDGLAREALDAYASRTADVAAEVRHLDDVRSHARLGRDDRLPNYRQVRCLSCLLNGGPAANASESNRRELEDAFLHDQLSSFFVHRATAPCRLPSLRRPPPTRA